MRNANYIFIAIALFVLGCAKDAPIDTELPVVNEPFTEGVVEMGMYSHGIDLGFFIDNIDFSRDDVQEQYLDLVENHEEGKQFVDLIQSYTQSNPMLGLALMMNGVVCTYYVKDEVVLGKARGLGYLFDNYHNAAEDRGQLFVRTLVQTDEIAEADRELSIQYTPSEDLGVGSGGAIDQSFYNRQVSSQKEVVAGYNCNVSTYTLKPEHIPEPDSDMPPSLSMGVYKIVVYTSTDFNKTINFTHPLYLPEDEGILKLEIYFENTDEPTLVMQPNSITPRVVTASEMQIEETQPMYDFNDLQVAFKLLSIMLSGWGAIGGNN